MSSPPPTDAAAAAAPKDPPPAAAASAASADDSAKAKKPAKMPQIDGKAIRGVLESTGPVVKAVLLRHMRRDGKDAKPHIPPPSPKHNGGNGAADEEENKHLHHRVVLTELIDEIDLDTTPSKNSVKAIMGGPFTFLGQFHTEGTMVVARRDLPDDLPDLSVSQLRELCADLDIDTKPMIEKSELICALEETQLPVNPHRLQPPLDKAVARGDILILKVAETEEVLDGADGGKEKAEKDLSVLTNDEFFLNYTKDEYVDFASRTDVVAPHHEPADGDEEEEPDEDEDSDDEEDFVLGDDECEEEEKQGMLNLVMGGVLKKFREENGRGPDTRELLDIRKHVADQLGVEVATLENLEKEDAEEEEKEAADEEKKRKADDLDSSHHKRVKFSAGEEERKDSGEGKEEEDSKVAAVAPKDGGEKSEP